MLTHFENKYKILIIDDQQPICEILEAFLSPFYQTKSISDSEKAMEILDLETFDLVITDIKMPKFDGFDICNKISKVSPSTYIILITGFADVDLAIKGIKLGSFDFIRKPFTVDEVLLSVRRAFTLREAERREKERNTQKSILDLIEGLKDKLVNRVTSAIWTRDFLEESLSPKLTEEEKKHFQILRESLQKVLEITTKLSEHTIGFGMAKGEMDISSVLKQISQKYTNITFHFHVPKVFPKIAIQTDSFLRCLDAIFENSKEACKNKNLEILMTLSKKNNDFVQIQIEDNGEGIEKENVDKIFTPFFTTKGTKPTGLGLWLVSQTIQHFEGHVSVNSFVGKGTVLTIELPIYKS
ncbi:hybrid sensor histidine kinase/response regulator [bacterium]|nr:hybrid sensor histidine kinase/response regulator [bacterium]